jgi:hypothetical protein
MWFVTNLYIKCVVFPSYDIEGFLLETSKLKTSDRFLEFRGKTPLSGCEMKRRTLSVLEIRK